jgi:hypothetical protein
MVICPSRGWGCFDCQGNAFYIFWRATEGPSWSSWHSQDWRGWPRLSQKNCQWDIGYATSKTSSPKAKQTLTCKSKTNPKQTSTGMKITLPKRLPVKPRWSSPKRKASLKKPPIYPVAAAAPSGDGGGGNDDDMDSKENQPLSPHQWWRIWQKSCCSWEKDEVCEGQEAYNCSFTHLAHHKKQKPKAKKTLYTKPPTKLTDMAVIFGCWEHQTEQRHSETVKQRTKNIRQVASAVQNTMTPGKIRQIWMESKAQWEPMQVVKQWKWDEDRRERRKKQAKKLEEKQADKLWLKHFEKQSL